VIPEEESRTKQYREIAQLLQEQPVVVSGTISQSEFAASRLPTQAGFSSDLHDTNAAGGPEGRPYKSDGPPLATCNAGASERVLPSVVPDEFTDNHAVELDACKRWFSSDAGQVAKIEAPAGYANVRAHAQLHEQFLRKQQLEAAQPAQSAGRQSAAQKQAAK
jgi:hypothetical protein